MDQYLIAALALVAFMLFAVLAYVFREERLSRIVIENSHRPEQPGTIETRSRRAF